MVTSREIKTTALLQDRDSDNDNDNSSSDEEEGDLSLGTSRLATEGETGLIIQHHCASVIRTVSLPY